MSILELVDTSFGIAAFVLVVLSYFHFESKIKTEVEKLENEVKEERNKILLVIDGIREKVIRMSAICKKFED